MSEKLRLPLILASVAGALTAAGYAVSSVVFTPMPSALTNILPRILPRGMTFGAVLWVLALGVALFAVSCFLTAAASGGFLRGAALSLGSVAALWALVLAYLAMDFRNIFMLMRYGMALSGLLAREAPNGLTALLCLGSILFLLGLILRFRNIAITITAVISALIFLICAAAFIINLFGFQAAAFFTALLPAAFLLLAVAALSAALKCGQRREADL